MFSLSSSPSSSDDEHTIDYILDKIERDMKQIAEAVYRKTKIDKKTVYDYLETAGTPLNRLNYEERMKALEEIQQRLLELSEQQRQASSPLAPAAIKEKIQEIIANAKINNDPRSQLKKIEQRAEVAKQQADRNRQEKEEFKRKYEESMARIAEMEKQQTANSSDGIII